MHFGLHEHVCFSTHFTRFIGVHSGLAYTQVIHSKPNTCVCTYYYTMESIPLEVTISVLTLLNKFTVSYGDAMYILTL